MAATLEEAYEGFRKGLHLPDALLSRASAPLLLRSNAAWKTSSSRALIIGQETNGWNSLDKSISTLQHFRDRTDGVAVMQDAYEAFALGENYRFRNSAFWRAFRVLTTQSAGLWTNLFRADVGGPVLLNCSRQEQRLFIGQQQDLLFREIQLLEPTTVVFVTGPRYDFTLLETFGDVRFKPLWRGVSERIAALVYVPSINLPMIRLYHPTYLQRSRQWGTLERAGQWLSSQ